MEYQTALSKLQAHMAAGRWDKAISMAVRWGNLGAHKAAITRAQGARVNPGFYRQLGQDPAQLIEAGKKALREGWG